MNRYRVLTGPVSGWNPRMGDVAPEEVVEADQIVFPGGAAVFYLGEILIHAFSRDGWREVRLETEPDAGT